MAAMFEELAENLQSASAEVEASPYIELGKALYNAAESGDLAGAKDALGQGADINFLQASKERSTPLAIACKNFRVDIVRFLLLDANHNRPNLDICDCYGFTALYSTVHFASQNPKNAAQILSLFIQIGGDIHTPIRIMDDLSIHHPEGVARTTTLLRTAIQYCISDAFTIGIDWNSEDNAERLPMLPIINMLVDNGVDLDSEEEFFKQKYEGIILTLREEGEDEGVKLRHFTTLLNSFCLPLFIKIKARRVRSSELPVVPAFRERGPHYAKMPLRQEDEAPAESENKMSLEEELWRQGGNDKDAAEYNKLQKEFSKKSKPQ